MAISEKSVKLIKSLGEFFWLSKKFVRSPVYSYCGCSVSAIATSLD
ncbi:hypothetical protein [Nostoc sp. TCL240-02]|nr:hypothetical protein [Nostoc sp. TCL240-02]